MCFNFQFCQVHLSRLCHLLMGAFAIHRYRCESAMLAIMLLPCRTTSVWLRWLRRGRAAGLIRVASLCVQRRCAGCSGSRRWRAARLWRGIALRAAPLRWLWREPRRCAGCGGIRRRRQVVGHQMEQCSENSGRITYN